MRIALVLYFLLLGLVAVHAARIAGWSLWTAAAAIAAGTCATAAVHFFGRRPTRMLSCLLWLGTVGLVAALVILAAPAWQIIDSGSTPAGVGRMAPMLVAALGIYGANLWLGTALRSANRDESEWIARLLAGPPLFSTFLIAFILCAGVILTLDWLVRFDEGTKFVTRRFLERGPIPPVTVLLFFWGLLILLGKRWNAWFLRRALRQWSEARRGDSENGARSMVAAGFEALASGRVESKEGLQYLRRLYEESYLLPRYLGWAVPILGFIGTVFGISEAAEGIRGIISSDFGLSTLSSELSRAIAPLGIAFDTTLIALSLSVVLTLVLSLVQRGEERVLAELELEVRRAAAGHE